MGRCMRGYIAEACAVETCLFSDGNLGGTPVGCVYRAFRKYSQNLMCKLELRLLSSVSVRQLSISAVIMKLLPQLWPLFLLRVLLSTYRLTRAVRMSLR